MIRAITVDDLPWVMSLWHHRYSKTYDPGAALIILTQAMRSALAIRADNAFLVAHTTTAMTHPGQRVCHVLAVCAEEGHHWQAIKLLRASLDWAQEKSCTQWWIDSETGHQVGSLAARVGAMPMPRYVIDIGGPK